MTASAEQRNLWIDWQENMAGPLFLKATWKYKKGDRRSPFLFEANTRCGRAHLFPYFVNTMSLDFAITWHATPHLASLPCGGWSAVVPGAKVSEAAS